MSVLLAGVATRAAASDNEPSQTNQSVVPTSQTAPAELTQPAVAPFLEQAIGEDGMIPVQRSLPDPASNEELQSERGTALFVLILGGTLMAALVVALLFFFTRRSWSAPSS